MRSEPPAQFWRVNNQIFQLPKEPKQHETAIPIKSVIVSQFNVAANESHADIPAHAHAKFTNVNQCKE